MRRGLTLTPWTQLRVREQRRGDEERRGRREVARDLDVGRLQALDRLDGRRSPGGARRARPAAASIRSVWSRVGSGSTTVVAPVREEPGEQDADFTCALATGSS